MRSYADPLLQVTEHCDGTWPYFDALRRSIGSKFLSGHKQILNPRVFLVTLPAKKEAHIAAKWAFEIYRR